MWIQRQYPLPFKSLRGRPFDFWRIFFNTKSLFPSWNNISLVRAFSTLEEKFHTSARSRHMFYCFQWRKFFSLLSPWKNFISSRSLCRKFFYKLFACYFRSYGFRGSFRLDSYFYVLPLFQKYILRTLQVQVCLGFLVTWFHEKAVKTKDNNLVNWQSINSSNNLQYFESGTPSKGGKSFCMVDNVIVNYLWKQSWSPALLGKGGK